MWLRYVDDVFSIVRRALVESFLDHLNKQQEEIRFTVEMEVDGKLPFMDVIVSHKEKAGELQTTVYSQEIAAYWTLPTLYATQSGEREKASSEFPGTKKELHYLG